MHHGEIESLFKHSESKCKPCSRIETGYNYGISWVLSVKPGKTKVDLFVLTSTS